MEITVKRINVKKLLKKIVSPLRLIKRPESISPDNLYSLLKKEFRSNFYNPGTYISATVFGFAAYFLFFGSFFTIGQASLAPLFDLLPWLLLLLVPALAMGSFATERRDGTLEYLTTKPISELELVIAKYLSVVGFAFFVVITTLPLPLLISFYADLDWGVVAGQYIAAGMLIGALSAVGLLVSALVENQVASFLATIVTSFFLLIIGSEVITSGIPLALAPILEQLSLLSHYSNTARGVIDLRDVLFFGLYIFILLYITRYALLSIKYPRGEKRLTRARLQILALTVVVALVGLWGNSIPGRLDLTEKGLYTISAATYDIIGNLPQEVAIDVYASQELPAQFQPTLRELRNLVDEYDRIGGATLQVNYRLIAADDEELTQEAINAGIRQVQFNVVNDSEVQFKSGFLGLKVIVDQQEEIIDFVDATDDLEYRLTSFINQLTNTDKSVVAFLQAGETASRIGEYSEYVAELESQFEVIDFNFATGVTLQENNVSVLVIPGNTAEVTEEQIQILKDYYLQGGNILLLDSKVTASANQGIPVAEDNQFSLGDLFADQGVVVSSGILYDLASSESVSTSTGLFNTVLPYPFWTLAQPATDSVVVRDVDQILVPWSAALEVKDKSTDFVVDSILQTSEFAGIQEQEEAYDISLQYVFPQDNLKTEIVGAQIKPATGNNAGSAIVIAAPQAFTNNFITYKQNAGFGMRLVETLAQDSALSEIRIKNRSAENLVLPSQSDENIIRWGVPVLSVGGLLTIAAVAFYARNRKMNRKYPD